MVFLITFHRGPQIKSAKSWIFGLPLNLDVKAGLIGLLVGQFRLPILVAIAYLCLSIAYHVSSLNTRW